MLSAIQIQQHHFFHVEIASHAKDSAETDEEQYVIEIACSEPNHNADRDLWNLNLEVRFGPEKDGPPVRYRGRLGVHGIFRIHPDFAPEKRVDLVKMNGGSLLLGAAREMILIITSRSARGPLELATFDARMFLEAGSVPRSAAED
jgi:hypothetical protein